MSVVSHKRAVMTLFSSKEGPESHQVRIVLAEKGVGVEIEEVEPNALPQELLEMNPYRSVPTLVDRDLVLYEPQIIMEYLDERFPHPPLMPVYPLTRANSRLMMYRIKREWYGLYRVICAAKSPESVELAKQRLSEELLGLTPVLASFPFFMSEEFSLVDCYLAPLFWRLQAMQALPTGSAAQNLHAYVARLFARNTFIASLTQSERDMGSQIAAKGSKP